MFKLTLFVASVSIFMIGFTSGEGPVANLRYKSNTTLNCALDGDVEFFVTGESTNNTEHKLNVNTTDGKFVVTGKSLFINDLRKENIYVTYSCKSNGKTETFVNHIQPYIFKPEKQSQTASEGGNAEFRCAILYGDEQGKITWAWKKNDTVLTSDDRIKIDNTRTNETILILTKVTEDDKGVYQCIASNAYGEHSEDIRLRVKDQYAALWPFLAIVAEVFILCTIILIYEKKCAKKNHSNEEDNEQAQNLMGNKDGQVSDVKKRNAKA